VEEVPEYTAAAVHHNPAVHRIAAADRNPAVLRIAAGIRVAAGESSVAEGAGCNLGEDAVGGGHLAGEDEGIGTLLDGSLSCWT
jgi:hypothetical protein